MLKKLQNLPEEKRKIIIWLVIGLLGLGLFSWWFRNAGQEIRNFREKEFIKTFEPPSSFGEELGKVSRFKEDLKKFEEMMEKYVNPPPLEEVSPTTTE